MSGLVHRNTVVTLDYSVTDSDGQVVDDGRNPIRYLHGGYGDIFDRIEETLEGKHVGDSVTIKLQPDEAYGDYDPELVQIEPASRFPKETKLTEEILLTILDKHPILKKVPVLYDLDFAHTQPLFTITIGGQVEIDTKTFSITFS